MSEFSHQIAADATWAFARMHQSDEKLFTAMARLAKGRMSDFNHQIIGSQHGMGICKDALVGWEAV